MNRVIPNFILLGLLVLTGCRGLESEMEKSAIRFGLPAVDIGNHHLSLSAKLARKPNGNKKGFDLTGAIEIAAQNENFPTNFSVPTFSLRPAWPGYYVVSFENRGGKWELPDPHGVGRNFSGTSQITNGVYTIRFTWRDQGARREDKPKHFAAYDIAVTISDARGKPHLLSQPDVPTK